MGRPPDPENGAGAPKGPDTNPHQEDPHRHDQVTQDRNGSPDVGCVMCFLIADTHIQRQDRIPHRNLARWASLSHALDLAGTHREGDPL